MTSIKLQINNNYRITQYANLNHISILNENDIVVFSMDFDKSQKVKWALIDEKSDNNDKFLVEITIDEQGKTMETSLIDKYLNDPVEHCLYREEEAILAATEEICKLMQEQNTDSYELSKRMEGSTIFLDRMLEDGTHLTMRNLAKILFHLGHKVEIKIVPLNK